MCEDCTRYRNEHKRPPREPRPDEEVMPGKYLYRAKRRETFPHQPTEGDPK
jgi:hypothetical protein